MKSAWIGFIRGDDFWERAKELAEHNDLVEFFKGGAL